MTTQAPAAAAARALPSQDDRLLAACAHLSFFTGFWLVAPIAIYVIKRKESRFVAFYALQAVLVQVLFGVGTTFLVIASIAFLAAAGASGERVLAAVAAFVPIFGLLMAAMGLLLVHAYAAFSAWRGADLSLPIAGRLARAIQGADEGALKA